MAKYLIKTFTGLEPVLVRELEALGAEGVQSVSRGAICEGGQRLLYRMNLELRTGLRVYQHLFDCDASSGEDLYYGVGDFDWSTLLKPEGTIYVTSTVVKTDWVDNSMIVTLKTKDAVVDSMRVGDSRPNIDRDRPDLRIHTYVHHGRGSVWLDSTGDPLFKRGYRLRNVVAPINEVLAAGILGLSDYNEATPLVDPMCGGGTFAVEAARLSLNIPAQSERRFFQFMNWPDFDAGLWNVIRQQGLSRINRHPIAPIVASDRDWRAIRAAEQNIREAGLAKHIELHEADFFQVSAPYDKGIVLFNPPYDERLTLESGVAFYEDIGTALKHDWPNWEAWVVSGFIDGLYAMGLTPKRKLPLDNGGIPVELWQIPLYAGSKRTPLVKAGGDEEE